MISVDVSVKNEIIGVLAKMIICGIPVHVVLNKIRHLKLMNN